MATNNSAVGVVTSTKGEVFARGEDGKMRRLNTGDQVFEHDVIVTANGSAADISMFNAPPLSINEQQTISVDAQVTAVAPDATAGSVAPLGSSEAAKVIQTVATGSGLDVNALLEDDAAAAGLTGGDGADGGHTFVDLMRIVENVPGAGYDFPTYAPGSAPTIQGQTLVEIDDIPQWRGSLNAEVMEEGMSYWTWDRSEGNRGPGVGLGADEAYSGVYGSLQTLVDFGADGPGTFSLKADTSGLPTLYSNGVEVQYKVDGDTLIGFVGSSEHPKLVFTLTVEGDGDWAFNLIDQLDHVAGDGQNTALQSEGGSVAGIDFSSLLQVADSEGDVGGPAPAGLFTITVVDDVPVLSCMPVIARVDEDDILTYQSQGTSPNDGPVWDGSVTGNGSNPFDSGPAVVTGSLAALVRFGADEPGRKSESGGFSINAENIEALEAQHLASQGDALTYVVHGNTLYAYAVEGEVDGGDQVYAARVVEGGDGVEGRLVFTLEVNSNGSYTFSLYDQLDHATGQGQNTLPIDFSEVVVATDADGDSITLDGKFSILVTDDVPKEVGCTPETGTVEEEALPGGNQELMDSSVLVWVPGGWFGHYEQVPVDGWPDTVTASGSLASHVQSGADEPIVFSLSLDGSHLPQLTSNHQAVVYEVVGDTLYAYVPAVESREAADAPVNGRVIFTLEVESNGNYVFTLVDQIDHSSAWGRFDCNGDGSEENVLTLNLSSVVVATDYDGDSITLHNSLSISVVDDVPIAVADTGSVTEDGVASASGNVLENDKVGADDPASFVGWDHVRNGQIRGDYGTLFDDGNGNYHYVLDNSKVQGLDAGETRTEAFEYTMKDADGDTSSAVLTITITGTNDPLDAVDDTDGFSAAQVQFTVSGHTNVLTNDVELDTTDRPLSVQDSAPQNVYLLNADGTLSGTVAGTIDFGTNGSYTLTLNSTTKAAAVALDAGETLKVGVEYTAQNSDTPKETDNAVLRITITGSDDPLEANDDTDTFTAAQAQSTINGVTNVLTNDVDPDTTDKPLVVDDIATQNVYLVNSNGTLSSTVAGTITFGANGSYTLNLNQATKDAATALDSGESLRVGVTYTAENQDGAQDNAILRITINGANDALDAKDDTDSFTAAQAQSTINGVTNVLANDVELDTTDRPLSVQDTAQQKVYLLNGDGSLSSTEAGTITFGSGGSYTLTLNDTTKAAAVALDDGETLKVGVEYTAQNSDTPKETDNAILRITINGQNDAPVANSDTNWVLEDSLTGAVGNMLQTNPHNGAPDNVARGDVADTDVDVETLTITGVTGGNQYGMLTWDSNGGYSYALTNSNATVQALNDGDKLTENYTYTVWDGTTSKTATLTITIFGANDPVLVVGENVNDVSGQTADHRVDTSPYAPDGSIDGSSSHDVLVGDVGGNNQLTGQKANIAFVLDCSGSMTQQSISFTDSNGVVHNITRLDALKQAVIDALKDLYASGANDVRVHIDTFASNAGSSGTFTLTSGGVDSDPQLQAAINFVNGLSVPADSYTNYEAGLVAANSWIDSSGANAPISGADVNKVIFVSDGAPNRALDSSNHVAEANASEAIDHIQGDFSGYLWIPTSEHNGYWVYDTDRTSEISLIETDGAGSPDQAFTIEAVGISVDSGALSNLSLVEGAGGAASNVDNANELSAVIGTLTGGGIVAQQVGNDTINGGAGNDLIFGDSIHADNVDGGWAKFVENHSGWSLDALRAELYANHATYGQEGSVGGNDTIDGGAGNDIIYAQKGNDSITGGAGDDLIVGGSGSDTMSGGTGADTFKFVLGDAGTTGTIDHITDFSRTSGDVLDFRDLLAGEDGVNPGYNLGDFMSIAKSGGNTILTISDTNGPATTGVASQTIVFDNTDLFNQFGVSSSGPNASENLLKAMITDNKLLVNG